MSSVMSNRNSGVAIEVGARRALGVLGAIIVSLLVLARPCPAAPAYITDATPRWTVEDRLGPGTPRADRQVTFSPNGDGIRDHATITGCVAADVEPMLAAFHRFRRLRIQLMDVTVPGPRLHPLRASAGCARGMRRWIGVWDGSAGRRVGQPRPQGSYWLSLCSRTRAGRPIPEPGSPFAPSCAPRPVLAQVQAIWLTLPWTRSAEAGERLAIRIQTDAPTVELTITDAAGRAVLARRAIAPKRVTPRLPDWLPAGLYRVRARAGTVLVDAPLAVRDHVPVAAPAPGTALVVAPSLTWLGYDRADVDRDGSADSWYATGPSSPSRGVSLHAPLLTLQPDSAEEDHVMWQPFFTWANGSDVPSGRPRRFQIVTDLELDAMRADVLRRYAAVWFPGHSEYYTASMYARLMEYRRAGGDLAFLSSNSFYRRVRVDRSTARVLPDWSTTNACACSRDGAFSDYAMVGTGFVTLDLDEHAPMFVADGAIDAAPWLFAGTGLTTGARVGYGVLELDGPPPPGDPAAAVFHPLLRGEERGVAFVSGISLHPGGGRTFSGGDEAFVGLLEDQGLPPAEQAALRGLVDNLWNEFVGTS